MNYLTVNPPPLRGDDESSTSNSDSIFPYGIPFTNQSAFQSAFTPEGFSFESPFGMPSSSFTNSSMDGNAFAGPSSAPRPKPFPANSGSSETLPSHLNGLSNIMPVDIYPGVKLGNTASSVDLVTGDRFSQLLEAKLGLNLESQNDALSSLSQPRHDTSNLDPFDHMAVEQVLKDYAQIQVPPDFVAPAVPESYLQSSIVQQFPFNPLDMAPNPNSAQQNSQNLPSLPSSNTLFQPSPSRNPATFHASMQSSTSGSRPSSKYQPSSGTPFDISLTGQMSSQSLPPPLRVHLQQTSTVPHVSNSSTAQANMMEGSWAMELLKGYKSAQTRHDFPSWKGYIGKDLASFPSQHAQSQTERNFDSSSSLAGASRRASTDDQFASSSLSGALSISTTPRKRTNERKEPRKKQSSKSDQSAASSDSEYEDTPKRKQSSTQRPARPAAKANGKADPDKAPVIACHTCRARKLKCDGEKPKCSNCTRRNEESCVYDTVLRRRGPGRNNKKDRRPRNSRSKGVGDAPKQDPWRSQSAATGSTSESPKHSEVVDLGNGQMPVMSMSWDQAIMSNMVR